MADTGRELGRLGRSGKVAESGGDLFAFGAEAEGRLPDVPGQRGDKRLADLGDEAVAGGRRVGFNGRTDAEGTRLLARVRGGVAFDVADVGKLADGGSGEPTGNQPLSGGGGGGVGVGGVVCAAQLLGGGDIGVGGVVCAAQLFGGGDIGVGGVVCAAQLLGGGGVGVGGVVCAAQLLGDGGGGGVGGFGAVVCMDQLLVGVGDEAAVNDGCTSAVLRGGPLEYVLELEKLYCCCD